MGERELRRRSGGMGGRPALAKRHRRGYLLLPPEAEEWVVLPLFYPDETKERFHVDAHGIRLGIPLSEGIVADIAYYYGLWSHRRKDLAWKGFVQIDLDPGLDDLARQLLEDECRRMRWT